MFGAAIGAGIGLLQVVSKASGINVSVVIGAVIGGALGGAVISVLAMAVWRVIVRRI